MNPDLNTFLQAWTGGNNVSPAEQQRVLKRFQDDADFRAECVAEIRLLGICKSAQSPTPPWPELSEVIGITDSQPLNVTQDFADRVMTHITRDSSPEPASRFKQKWRPLMAAAAGLVLGFFSASVAWAVVRSNTTMEVRHLLLTGFEAEDTAFQNKFPEQPGIWNSNQPEIISSESAIEGSRVLRFHPELHKKLTHLNYMLDATSFPRSAPGEVRDIRLSARIRSVEDAPTKHRYTLRLATFAEQEPANVKELWFSGSYMSDTAITFASRSERATREGWVTLEASVPLPPEARQVILSIGATSTEEARQVAIYEVDGLNVELVTTHPRRH